MRSDKNFLVCGKQRQWRVNKTEWERRIWDRNCAHTHFSREVHLRVVGQARPKGSGWPLQGGRVYLPALLAKVQNSRTFRFRTRLASECRQDDLTNDLGNCRWNTALSIKKKKTLLIRKMTTRWSYSERVMSMEFQFQAEIPLRRRKHDVSEKCRKICNKTEWRSDISFLKKWRAESCPLSRLDAKRELSWRVKVNWVKKK